MRLAMIAVLALSGCAEQSPGVRQIGPNQFVVTASCFISSCTPQHTATDVALERAHEKCASVGKRVETSKIESDLQPGWGYTKKAWGQFECW